MKHEADQFIYISTEWSFTSIPHHVSNNFYLMPHSHLRLGSFGYVTQNFVFCLYSHNSFCYMRPSEHHVYANWHTKFWAALLVWIIDFDCLGNYEGIKLTNFFENKLKATVFLLSLVQRERERERRTNICLFISLEYTAYEGMGIVREKESLSEDSNMQESPIYFFPHARNLMLFEY